MTDSDTPDTLDITVYGAYWCPDCHRAKQFLGEHQIPYHWVDIEEDPEGERFVIEANEGKRRIPTLVFGDGSVLSNPTNAELAARLGMKTTAERLSHDNGSEYSALALLLATGSNFAAGDVRATSTKQVTSAAGEGAAAALMIRDHLKTV